MRTTRNNNIDVDTPANAGMINSFDEETIVVPARSARPPIRIKNKKSVNFKYVAALAALIIVVSFMVFGRGRSGNTTTNTKDDVKQLIADVSKIMFLPQGEEPTIATVSDPSKLKGQEFFAHASIGDKVLIYVKAGKAILYSPSRGMIIEVAPLNTTQGKTGKTL